MATRSLYFLVQRLKSKIQITNNNIPRSSVSRGKKVYQKRTALTLSYSITRGKVLRNIRI